MTSLKGAVIGLGRIGWEVESDLLRNKPSSHVGAMLNNKNIKLVAVCDRNEEKLKSFKNLYPEINVYDSVRNMVLEERDLNIITIATNDVSHSILANLCFKLCENLKVLLCEKPISDNVDNAKIIVEHAKEKGIKFAVNHTRRWMPEYQNVKRIIDCKDLGEPVFFVGFYYGGLRDFIHLADLYNWLTPETPYAFHKIDYGNTTDYMVFEQDIFLSEGRIMITDNAREITYYKSHSSWYYENIRELDVSFKINSKQIPTPISLVYEDLVKCALTEKQPECTGEDGLKALEFSLKFLGGE